MSHDVAALRALAESAARAGGDLIRAGLAENGAAARAVEETKSTPTDIVTAMDQAVERLLRDRLGAARPHDGLLGEEAGYTPGGSGLSWVLDPIDGTVNYRYGIDAYAVSVAVVEGDPTVDGAWTPVAACVHNPATGDTWTAGRGLGAQLAPGDGSAPRELRMGTPPELGQALVATGFGYAAVRRAGQARVLTGVLPQVRDIRRIGSAALDLCGVATGTVDAFYERGVHVWDIAAATLVLMEAGGAISGLRGAPAGGAMVVGAASPLLEGICDVLGQLDADSDPT
ncbi:inositol monophosphatase [Kineosporia sp. J2-2]|uniref:Inositol-1-monophosphatase n=1 Tax=Kineosporia corallincola TaxID=2835133 RepID=A0ABS5TDP2_9ACTN|nr:inositol monophosphatase family protein [Kineosporia corallincola]MBT0769207.1 inositol monophosphatase [Kineosporia corallincola]